MEALGDRRSDVAATTNEWQANLPPFSAAIFRTAPYLGLVGAETDLPAPVRPASCVSTLAELTSEGDQRSPRSPRSPKGWWLKAVASVTARHAASEVKKSSIADQAASTLPSWLLSTLKQHHAEIAELFRGWDAARRGTVPLGVFAQAVHGVCGVVLSEDELGQLLCAVQPEQGEPPSGKPLHEQAFDYNRLTHAIKVNKSRSASAYIRRSSSVSALT